MLANILFTNFSSLLQDVIDHAVEKQFNDYLIANNFDPDTMSEEEKNKHKATYITDLYAGTTLTPDSILNVLSSENPTRSGLLYETAKNSS